jgi:hypothetical protein
LTVTGTVNAPNVQSTLTIGEFSSGSAISVIFAVDIQSGEVLTASANDR